MSKDKNKPPFPSNPQIVTRTYRGPDRRDLFPDDTPSGEVEFDDKGNPVWKVKASKRGRKDDDTFDMMKALAVDSLSLESDKPRPEPSNDAGYDPYSREDD